MRTMHKLKFLSVANLLMNIFIVASFACDEKYILILALAIFVSASDKLSESFFWRKYSA